MNRASWFVMVSAVGCGSSPASRYTSITNGGIPIMHGLCRDLAMVRSNDEVVPARAGQPACTEGDLIAVGAAGVYWRVAGSALAGPVAANAVELRVPVQSLDSGEVQRGLRAGASSQALASGEAHVALRSAQAARGLASGTDARGLASGTAARGLASGADAKRLDSSEERRGLESGESARDLRKHLADKPVVEIRKSVDRDTLRPGAEAEYALDLRNVGVVPLSYAVVFDRIPASLDVIGTDASTTRLPDGSTLVLWARPIAIGPGARASFKFRAKLRSKPPPTPVAPVTAPAAAPPDLAPASDPPRRIDPPKPAGPTLAASALQGLRVGQRIHVLRVDGSAVEGAITEVDEAHVVVQGTRHGLATPANQIATITVLSP